MFKVFSMFKATLSSHFAWRSMGFVKYYDREEIDYLNKNFPFAIEKILNFAIYSSFLELKSLLFLRILNCFNKKGTFDGQVLISVSYLITFEMFTLFFI